MNDEIEIETKTNYEIIPEQRAIRVFENYAGDIAIVAVNNDGLDDVVTIAPQHVETLIAALRKCVCEMAE